MKELQNSYNKTYNIATSSFSYMVFAILTILLFYLVAVFAPHILLNVLVIIIICILYCILLFYVYIKGEKLIITKDTIQIKSWFQLKNILIREIDSYKIMVSSYTNEEKIIIIHIKNNKKITINKLSNSDFDSFINWLKSKIKNEDELQIDPLQKLILQHGTKFNPNLLNQNKTLKTYKVGKNLITIFLLFNFIIALFTIPIILTQNTNINSNILMYTQTIGGVVLIIMVIIYTIFIQNKLSITKDAIILKGLFLNRKLKFNEIKGYVIEYSRTYTVNTKLYKHITIIPNNNTLKKIIIRPTNKSSFTELTGWIAKNLKKIE